jgi:hypothetical protein
LAALALGDQELDDLHLLDRQMQTDRARDAARSMAQGEWAPGKPDAVPSAAQSCAGRAAAFAQSASRELAAAMLARLASPPVAQRTVQLVAASWDALGPECSRQAYSPPEQMALQEIAVAPQPGPCTQAEAGWSAQQLWARAAERQQVSLASQPLAVPQQARMPQAFPPLAGQRAVMEQQVSKRLTAVFR